MASGQPDYTRQVAVTVIDTPDPITVIADVTSPPLNVTFPSTQDVNVKSDYISGRTATFEDASFVTGDSPATHDVNAALGRNAHDGYLVNDGAGDLTYQISNNGITYGGSHTLKKDETVKLSGLDIDSIKITWIANCGYRIAVF